MATDNVVLVKRLVEEVWNKGNLNVADELSASSCSFHDPISRDLSSLDAFKKHVQNLRTGFPDLRVDIEDIGVIGDKVYLRWTSTGTHKGSFLGIAPTNKRGAITGMSVNRVQGSKIVETWMSYDVLGLLQQLGIAPSLEQFTSQAAAARLSAH